MWSFARGLWTISVRIYPNSWVVWLTSAVVWHLGILWCRGMKIVTPLILNSTQHCLWHDKQIWVFCLSRNLALLEAYGIISSTFKKLRTYILLKYWLKLKIWICDIIWLSSFDFVILHSLSSHCNNHLICKLTYIKLKKRKL